MSTRQFKDGCMVCLGTVVILLIVAVGSSLFLWDWFYVQIRTWWRWCNSRPLTSSELHHGYYEAGKIVWMKYTQAVRDERWDGCDLLDRIHERICEAADQVRNG